MSTDNRPMDNNETAGLGHERKAPDTLDPPHHPLCGACGQRVKVVLRKRAPYVSMRGWTEEQKAARLKQLTKGVGQGTRRSAEKEQPDVPAKNARLGQRRQGSRPQSDDLRHPAAPCAETELLYCECARPGAG